MKRFSLFIALITILSTQNSFVSKSEVELPTKLFTSTSVRDFQVTLNSPTYYANGCSFFFTLTITFSWDMDFTHPLTNVVATSVSVNYYCQGGDSGYVRSASLTTDSMGFITDISIDQPASREVTAMADNGFRAEFIENCNIAIQNAMDN